jgi:hypothetical protein
MFCGHTPYPYSRMTSKTFIKLAGFAAALAALFGGAALAGGAIDPHHGGQDAPAQEHSDMSNSPHTAPDPVRGLAVAQDDLRLVVDDTELRRGATENLRFRIAGADGAAVRDFDVEHEKRMHVIVVRRDLTGFQHLHPTMAADGTWTTPVRLDDAGSYRVFADFSHQGDASTLAADLRVDGNADLKDLPAPAALAKSDGGYDVRLDAEGGELHFTITRDGRPIEAEPYLGARGHLVALREGDLAFLHVHPHDDSVAFEAAFPTEGRYRLFLQFKHEGRVQTVAFTREVTR